MVTLEIDGVRVVVPAGTSVMRAAASIDRRIPKLCATDTLEAFGSCRLCLVEIEGRYHHPRRQDDATGKGSGSDEEESGHPILSIMVCPGKRPYAPKK